MRGYDKDLVRREVLAICDHYLAGGRRREGKRCTYPCSECGERNFEVEPNKGYAGCFDPACAMPTSTDSLGIIAHFEGKELRGGEFIECVKRGYEILGIPEPEQRPGNSIRPRRRENSPSNSEAATDEAESSITSEAAVSGGTGGRRRRWSAAGGSAEGSGHSVLGHPVQAWEERSDGSRRMVEAIVIEDGEAAQGSSEEASGPEQSRKETVHAVYDALLKLCRCKNRDFEFFEGRGVDRQTVTDGRFGSISAERCKHITAEMEKQISDVELLSVPGFYRSDSGWLRFSLYGEYALIPYYDREGYIRTIEGRLTDEPRSERDKKYKAPVNSGVHLYVHPRFSPDEVVAFCEGAIGAMVAARYGLAVASIKGFRNYKQPASERGGDGKALPELEGVNFSGRTIVYIPDVDVKPLSRRAVMESVPRACEWLIERQGGVAKVATLPEGYKDLDEWLLGLPDSEKVERFDELLAEAIGIGEWKAAHLASGESQAESQQDADSEGAEADDSGSPEDALEEAEEQTADLPPSSNRREYTEDSQEDEGSSQPEESDQREEEQQDTPREIPQERCASRNTLREPEDEEGDTTELAQISDETASATPERAAPPAPPCEGEGVLAAAVFVLVALALTVALHSLLVPLLPWIWAGVAAAFLALVSAVGFWKLREARRTRKLRHHVEGKDV